MARSRKRVSGAIAVHAEANRLYNAGDIPSALRVAEEGLRRFRGNVDLLATVGLCRLATGYLDEAIAALERVPLGSPTGPISRANLAAAYRAAGRLEDAHRELDVVLGIAPEHPYALCKKGEILAVEGRLDEAETLLRAHVEGGGDVYPGIAATWGQVMLYKDEPARAVGALRAASESDLEGEPGRVWPTFLLAQCLDRLGEYGSAFEAYRRANDLRRMRHDARGWSAGVRAMIEAWTRERVEQLPVPDGDPGGDCPVFIVGMPRSGTSLVEQVLSTLEGVHGAGELEFIPRAVRGVMQAVGSATPDLLTAPQLLMQGTIDGIAAEVITEMRKLGGDAERITDKNPLNVFDLGLIQAVFPSARVIHCLRDPMDTCLSCFQQNFGSAISFAYDLGDIGAYYNDYRAVIAHWKSVLDIPIMDVRYEALVADPEPVMREMVSFIGMEWDDKCLAFHESDRVTHTASNDQVRRPLYKSSVAKWRRYGAHLGPLIEALEPEYRP